MFKKNNRSVYLLLFGALFIPLYALQSSDYPLVYLIAFIKNNISTLTAGALLVGTYTWIRTPRAFYPTLKKLHTITLEPLKKNPNHYLKLPDFIALIKTNKPVNTPVAMPKSLNLGFDLPLFPFPFPWYLLRSALHRQSYYQHTVYYV